MAFLNQLHRDNFGLPIIYIINELSEIDNLTQYAQHLGYYIPTEGTSFRKLEYIGNHPHGMVIISKAQFLEGIGSYRTDKPYCYVWDNMGIEQYMIMWDTLPFQDDYEPDIEADKDETVFGTTPRQCIYAAWPVFEQYYTLAMANNKDTKFYVLDPHFDDYTGLAKDCHAKGVTIGLWDNEEEYNASLSIAQNFFPNFKNSFESINTEEAMEVIRQHFIDGNAWHEEQVPLLKEMIERKGDYLISLPTGGGKSVLFQGPAILRASFSHRLSLVVSPLRALMQDQVEELHAKGFVTNVDYLSGDRLRPETLEIYRRIQSGEIALLYITPERFRVKTFINALDRRLHHDGGLEYIVFDEAHCISQWGQDFRPDYRNAVLHCTEYQKLYDIKLAMFSATVTAQVENDITRLVPSIMKLGKTSKPVREHIDISFAIHGKKDQERVKAIAQYIKDNNIDFDKSCMLVFCRTHSQCSDTAQALNEYCLNHAEESRALAKCVNHIDFFHAGLDSAERNDKYKQFRNSSKDNIPEDERIMVLCSTKAFGMGMDIPNIHYVVHYSPPSILEDYLQEVGRAGRDIKLYNEVFNNGSECIPALCLTSDIDFKTLKDLLIKSMLGWSDLTLCKNAIIDYILQVKTSLQDTMTIPVVVPYNVWVKDNSRDNLNETTASRLAFSWLERIGYIRQRFLGVASLSITLYQNKPSSWSMNDCDRLLMDYFYKHAERIGKPTPFALDDIKRTLLPIRQLSTNAIINSILRMCHKQLLCFNQKIRCMLKSRRFGETHWMIKNKDKRNALHIAINGITEILSNCSLHKDCIIDMDERERISKNLSDDVRFEKIELKYEEKKEGKDNKEVTWYMPWKDMEGLTLPDGAVTKLDTFTKDIVTRVANNMFRILWYIPDVDFEKKQTENDVIYRIRVKNETWKSFLPQLEKDCLKWLEYICTKEADPINWADAIVESGLSVVNDYDYFNKILDVLTILQFITHTPLLPSGVEVLTNDKTDTDIDDGTESGSPMYALRKDFDDQERTKKVRLTCMNIFSTVGKKEQKDYVQSYFKCRNYGDYLSLVEKYAHEGSDIMYELTDEALKIEEKRLEGNLEQQAIYKQPPFNDNINVLAGPGAGKTHILTLRCARLIYKEHVNPQNLLVLAYNRAVVMELRNRLDKLFSELGMSKMAHLLHVYTFHGLAKKCLGANLNNVALTDWESRLLNYLQNNKASFKVIFPDIKNILVDEFQDITDTRLGVLNEIHNIFPKAKLFTIGDINQSIYGFEKAPRGNNVTPYQYAEALNPQPYYDKLDRIFHPKQMTMFTNYRSFQKILDAAASFLPQNQKSRLPKSAKTLMKYEPKKQYVIYSDDTQDWVADVCEYAKRALDVNSSIQSEGDEYKRINTIAVFFRTNNEVYKDYARLKKNLPSNVRIRIQGATMGEVWRQREFYDLLHELRKHGNQEIILDENNHRYAPQSIKTYLINKIKLHPAWDRYTFDMAYTLVLDYCESIRNDNVTHTWREMADFITDIADKEDGQLYKIYSRYHTERIIQEDTLSVVLTTMHKVKGLEFDAVFITPSRISLPMVPHRKDINDYKDGSSLLEDDMADIEEERRLMYVAYTRAKKYLHVYKGVREEALEEKIAFVPKNEMNSSLVEKNSGLDKYILSYPAKSVNFNINQYISNNVKIGDEIIVERLSDGKCCIKHNDKYIGRLSRNSVIESKMNSTLNCNRVSGLFVNSIIVWTYDDTVEYDRTHGSQYKKDWCPDAKQQDYVYIVQIAGYGEVEC